MTPPLALQPSPFRRQSRCFGSCSPCKPLIRAQAASPAAAPAPAKLPELAGGNVVVVGGSGRIGGSTAAALLTAVPGAKLTLASRSVDSYKEAVSQRPALAAAAHRQCNIDDPASLASVLKGADLVIHAAGPFQRRPRCDVLEASIAAGVPYLDVCDDSDYAQRAKGLHSKAAAAGVPAITSAGIYPGVSNVMAAHMISIARKEYNEDWSYAASPGEGAADVQRLLYSYYTAGTGGAGPTILETSFLLAGEEVVAYKDGQKVLAPPVSNGRVVDFGPGVGRRTVYLYNLPEVSSGHQVFGVPSVSARFGTTDIWNIAMWLTARLAPKGFLENPSSVRAFGGLVGPLVRAVDAAVGEKVAMLVEVEFADGKIAAGLFVHNSLSQSVGIATAAFARCMLAGHTQPGVWFPEERGGLSDRRALLTMAAEGTRRFVLNKPPWAIESEPKQLGFGIYI